MVHWSWPEEVELGEDEVLDQKKKIGWRDEDGGAGPSSFFLSNLPVKMGSPPLYIHIWHITLKILLFH